MAEIMSQLETLAYLAGSALSVDERRELDALLRESETKVDEMPTRRLHLSKQISRDVEMVAV